MISRPMNHPVLRLAAASAGLAAARASGAAGVTDKPGRIARGRDVDGRCAGAPRAHP